ncbi:trehalose 6-phosphate phosphatase [Sinosporangium album]|uniref:Trehalose 6-phosphate phosphatase n=1 Tax=Sinosporangium album TaxID=504805 RepID=A0A1G8CI51_9ACTN|nr:trehalose-phosphatase [Sinosporangium album]SDH45092.1 trehalose 6-phosphate phosphatase [Sinosporangium album]
MSTLPHPTTEAGAAGLSAILADPSGAVIALDFDGTLSPIVADPASARIHPFAPAALVELGRRTRAVVIVTGRPAALAISYGRSPGGLGLDDVPGLVVLGQYGVERWESDVVTAPPPPEGVARARRALPSVLAALGPSLRGVWVEDKGRALAVHTRRTPDPQGSLETLRAPLVSLAAEHGLTVEPGRFVLELRPTGTDKGDALGAFLVEKSARSVLFAGDDLGDLAAFAAVRGSGLPGVTVCSGSAEVTELAKQADLVVDGPSGVVGLLSALVAAIDGKST